MNTSIKIYYNYIYCLNRSLVNLKYQHKKCIKIKTLSYLTTLIFFRSYRKHTYFSWPYILSTTYSEVKHSEKKLIISEMKLRKDYEKAAESFCRWRVNCLGIFETKMEVEREFQYFQRINLTIIVSQTH